MVLPDFAKPDEIRSANMRAIRSQGNRSTEWRLRSLLIRSGCRGWKVHPNEFIGKPDFAFLGSKVLVFIDGCYWHGCPKCGHIPKTNIEYWIAKIGRNIKRDKRCTRELSKQGFTVIRIWECSLKRNPIRCLQRVLGKIS